MNRLPNDVLRDVAARATVGALFMLLSLNLLADFMRTGRITGLLLLVGELLVVVLMVVRRRTQVVDRSATATVLTALSVAGPPLMRASDVTSLAPDHLTALLSAVGLVVVVLGKIALGRSFGLVPANRGVVIRGPYSLVRHPIYTGYLATHFAFLLASPSRWNVAVVLIADTALIFRALKEERILGHDAVYQQYCRRVGWHLIPGVF